ncbi:lipoyl amidotransferase LIPT1, mitochondrial-like isoform X2 [Oratosquilla oratoria]|uniref:lipoyl amidotransferase LIPT1, mitochondrial-like isoform X2 n=1 Tax=Oratosquilla oratoria TaxID=337810 RepID=UPI003F7717E6
MSLPTLGRIQASVRAGMVRHASMSASKVAKAPGKVVFISQSTNVFNNLAFEEWLYRNWNFEKRHLLFLWRNSPCVVIGKHQNPYVEANLPYMKTADVPVARRQSGGGTVYHDQGNLNCTFFTPRESYNRRQNLEVVGEALRRDFGIEADINTRDDLVVNGQKVSGTAAKLGRKTAYHHCTVLVDADSNQLKLALQGDKSITSKATVSIPSPVQNLKALNEDLSVEKLLESVGKKYLEMGVMERSQCSLGFTLINPSDDWFPGLGGIKAEMESWQFLYGKTPRFTVTRRLHLPESLSGGDVLVSVQSYHGIIEEVKAEGTCSETVEIIQDIGSSIKGSRYSSAVFEELENRLRLPVELRKVRAF